MRTDFHSSTRIHLLDDGSVARTSLTGLLGQTRRSQKVRRSEPALPIADVLWPAAAVTNPNLIRRLPVRSWRGRAGGSDGSPAICGGTAVLNIKEEKEFVASLRLIRLLDGLLGLRS
jgi:hypothetical protein